MQCGTRQIYHQSRLVLEYEELDLIFYPRLGQHTQSVNVSETIRKRLFDYTLTVGNAVQLRTDGMSLDRECILPADKALPRQRLCSLKESVKGRRGKAAETGIQPLGGTEPHIAACGGIRSGTKSHSAVHCKCTLVSERVYLLAHEPLKPE